IYKYCKKHQINPSAPRKTQIPKPSYSQSPASPSLPVAQAPLARSPTIPQKLCPSTAYLSPYPFPSSSPSASSSTAGPPNTSAIGYSPTLELVY
ncbi:MAG: hypothetical protein Q9204_009278, partial [Flavoplaca sp. TL-2023a]